MQICFKNKKRDFCLTLSTAGDVVNYLLTSLKFGIKAEKCKPKNPQKPRNQKLIGYEIKKKIRTSIFEIRKIMEQNRISVKVKNPNPLFEKWLSEWRDEAASNGSKMEHCFNKALASLKKYPLPLSTGRSCKVLEGFGERLCAMLDKKLTEHKTTNVKTKQLNQNTEKRARLSGKYVPGIGTGGYAILVTLYEQSLNNDYPGYMLRKDLIKIGQRLSDHSFSRPDSGSFYTAWSSMKTLLSKSLVLKMGNPAKFSLTEEGIEIARKLYEQRLRDKKEVDLNNLQMTAILTFSPFLRLL